jgi:hypothetical protein
MPEIAHEYALEAIEYQGESYVKVSDVVTWLLDARRVLMANSELPPQIAAIQGVTCEKIGQMLGLALLGD